MFELNNFNAIQISVASPEKIRENQQLSRFFCDLRTFVLTGAKICAKVGVCKGFFLV